MNVIEIIKFITQADNLLVSIPVLIACIASIVGFIFFKKKRKKK